ncbi:S-formylglutathione hydrolase FrmB [Nocardia transvalensis]|uniref:S-formylglutathione hydrolase FrmB n=1 Tax=Nocardia transvalensis TaxID=37333 RepID=A0A7W9PA10_9NOCA|nr:alpha/beta hydrolase family protein [Nocardia transvalensis]MBB5911938.1 S-formylglutathione hydrolase FrmB [Nocardia transvalensis]
MSAAVIAITTALSAAAVAEPVAAPVDPITSSGRLLESPVAPNGSRISGVTVRDGRHLTLSVHSAAMNKDITVDVQRPADTSAPRPVLYLLNGSGGGEDMDTWGTMTDALRFLDDKNANIVQPIGGAWSLYTDWIRDDPVLGRNKWTTFLTEELPPLVDAALGTARRNAIVGLSMAGDSVLALAIRKPDLFRSVASYSGCAQTSDPLGQRVIKTMVEFWGHGDPANMWGPDNGPLWIANDPYVHAERLRGVNLFISAGNGLPGPHDTLDSPFLTYGATRTPDTLANQILLGGLIEAGVNACTRNLQNRLNDLGIPATYDFTATGTHSWGYWQDSFKQSWPVLAEGLGL